jgi:type IV pilus assembly protein PilY1
VVNAWTGQQIAATSGGVISTGAGTAANPAGLAKITTYSTSPATDNTVLEVYGGDLLGNLWRFDVNNAVGAAGYDAQRLVTVQDPSGNPQPLMAKPALGEIGGKPIVVIGTGQYLGVSDLSTVTTNSIYAVKDSLDANSLATPRAAGSNFVQQTMVEQDCPSNAPATVCQPGQVVRTMGTTNAVDWSVKNGWYVDFPVGGERSVTDLQLALGTLVFTTIKPQSATADAIIGCTGGSTGTSAVSSLYYLDYTTGGSVDGTKNVVGEELCTCIATRPAVVRTESGTLQGIIRTSGDSSGGDGAGSGTGSTGSSGTGTGTGGSTNSGQTDAGGGGGGTACANHNAATCADNVGSDLAGNKDENIPYKPDGGPPRRISWRELNGL